MKTASIALLLAIGLAVAGPSLAQATNEHTSHHPAAKDLTDGDVRKIDKEAGKLTIKHGAIKNLDMPGMTMVFQVRDKALLDKVRAGDKIRFRAETENGKFVVTSIELAK